MTVGVAALHSAPLTRNGHDRNTVAFDIRRRYIKHAEAAATAAGGVVVYICRRQAR